MSNLVEDETTLRSDYVRRIRMSNKGWGFPARSRKAHYFNDDPISLCGKWMFIGERFDNKHEHPDNCKPCMKKRNAL